MILQLRVVSGARAGHVVATSGEAVRIGREEGLELRFDPTQDLEVSGRHATISLEEGRWLLRDVGSRNGTFIEGRRVEEPTELRDGLRISFGPTGPEIEVRFAADPDATWTVAREAPGGTAPARVAEAVPAGSGDAAPPAPAPRETTAERIRLEVGRVTRRWKAAVLLLLLIGATVATLGLLSTRREREAWERERVLLLARMDSAVAAGEASIRALEGEMEGLAEALRQAQDKVRQAGEELRRAERSGDGDRMPELRRELEDALASLGQHRVAAELDHPAIRQRNAPAVARIYSETASGEVASGTAFAVRADALLVTSRHVVEGANGESSRRLAAQFSYSDQVWPARVLMVDRELDLALVKVDGIIGSVPTVQGLNLRGDTLGAGSPVLIIGYPDGGESMASDRPGRMTITPITGAGLVGTVSPQGIEVLGFGSTGSSGSPVLDADGNVMAVVFGGRSDAGTHYLLAVPASAASRLLLKTSGTLSPR